MVRSLCRLVIYVNHALVANFNVANMSFNAIRESKILTKLSEFMVHVHLTGWLILLLVLLDFSLTVKAATLIFIYGCGWAISSAEEGNSGSIFNLVKS